MRILALAAMLAGCGAVPPYVCATDADCNGGVCSDQRCAISDPDCPSGLRFDSSAGSIANRCVGAGPAATTGDHADRPAPLEDFQVVDIATATDDYQPSCATATGGRDVFFETVISEASRLYVDTYGSDFSPVIAVHRGACNARTAELACGTGACAPRVHQWSGVVEPGVYCVIADRLDDRETGTRLVLRSFEGDPAPLGHVGENVGNTCADDLWDGTCAQTVDAPDTEWFITSCKPTTVTISTCTTEPGFDGELQAYTLSEIEKACTLGCTAQITLDEPGGVWLVAQARNENSCDTISVDITAP